MAASRVGAGGRWIDRDAAPIRFTFDGRELEGLQGDTLASALLAAGVDVVCDSPILGRPRGVFSAGIEEPCAFVEVLAPWVDPIVPATAVELVEGLVARGRPGVGKLPAPGAGGVGAPEGRYRYHHVETMVIGGGLAGLRATREAAAAGDRVLLVDEQPVLGGTATAWDTVDGISAPAWVDEAVGELTAAPDVTVLTRATALGVYDQGSVVVHERPGPGGGPDRIWHVRSARVVMATGAHERPIPLADGDRPGVMLAGSAASYLDRFGVLPGERVVVFTTNHAAYRFAEILREAGAEIVAILDAASEGAAADRARAAGIDVRHGWSAVAVDGEPRVHAVHAVGPDGRTATFGADLLLVSGGWNPVIQLARAIGAGLRYDEERACFVPDGTGPSWLSMVGAAAGEVPRSEPLWYAPPPPGGDLARHFMDLQRDATVADVLAAVGEGFRSVEHVKRVTYIGTALDQGRTSGAATAEVVNLALGWGPGAQGPTNARPPYAPVSFSVLAGADRGPQGLDPVRTTPIHPWHVERGAVFEDAGRWKRARFYPTAPGEPMDDAVTRECLAVRERAGLFDASTLGKIEGEGPDAAEFLDRMYANRMSTLEPGRIRYGVMLGLDGMVFDDGVVLRLAPDRFWLTTTTGGVAGVFDRFEEWLQTEWPSLKVRCTSVTEQWATVVLAGPRAREVLARAVPRGRIGDLDPGAFPFMTFRDTDVAGVPARIARVSFNGELSYEISVASWRGLHVWEALLAAGEAAGIAPYGTEAMHVLRAEKGLFIVGQETDGTVTPDDLGLGWIVRKDDSDFIGRRSLSRPDTRRTDRKRLVGLLPEDPDTLLPEGAQLIEQEQVTPPMRTRGHVTSSYRSPALGRTFALGLLEGGLGDGERRVFASTATGTVPVQVVPSVFYDPEGHRRDG